MSEPIAIARNSAEIVAALGKIREMRGLSNQFCDTRGGLTEGHCDKVLGPAHTKAISEMTLDTFMELFAVQFIVVPNPEAEDRMKAKWEGRDSSNVRLCAHRVSKQILERAQPHILKALAAKGNAARNSMLPGEHRTEIAKRAANIRWKRRGLKQTKRARSKRAWWRSRKERDKAKTVPNMEKGNI